MKKLFGLAILLSSSGAHGMFYKFAAKSFKLACKPMCHERIAPIIAKPEVKSRLAELSETKCDEKLLETSIYDAFNPQDQKDITEAFMAGTIRMLSIWEIVGAKDQNDFFRFYLPHTFFRNYPPFDTFIDHENCVHLDLYLPIREILLKKLAHRFPGSSNHALRSKEQLDKRPMRGSDFILLDPSDKRYTFNRLALMIKNFDKRLALTAQGMDKPCLKRMRLTAQTCNLFDEDRR